MDRDARDRVAFFGTGIRSPAHFGVQVSNCESVARDFTANSAKREMLSCELSGVGWGG